MKTKPIVQSFSKSIAMDLQQHLTHLTGLPIGYLPEELAQKVDEVILLPWDNFNRWLFRQRYLLMNNAVHALSYYNGYFFDVAVLSKCNGEGLIIKDVRSFLTEMGMEEELDMIRDCLMWAQNNSSEEEVESFSFLSF